VNPNRDRRVAEWSQWPIPAGTVLPPGSFLLVWADDDTEQNGLTVDLHASFKLDQDLGEAIGLFTPESVQVDAITFGPNQPADQSRGRFGDGEDVQEEFLDEPTPHLPNIPPLG